MSNAQPWHPASDKLGTSLLVTHPIRSRAYVWRRLLSCWCWLRVVRALFGAARCSPRVPRVSDDPLSTSPCLLACCLPSRGAKESHRHGSSSVVSPLSSSCAMCWQALDRQVFGVGVRDLTSVWGRATDT